jgi:hypothetical protein
VIVAARAATHPEFLLTALSEELRDAHGRLDALSGQDAATDLRAMFSWSYDALSGAAARLLRLMGLLAAPDITLTAAASLAGLALDKARAPLSELADAHLVVEHQPGRFTLHDLLRVYAEELAHTHDPEPRRRLAMRRILDHHLHTGYAAALILQPRRDPITLAPPHPAVTLADIGEGGRALDWFITEHPVLLAGIGQAAAAGFDVHAWQLPWTLETFYSRRGHWHDWIATQSVALKAARRLGDRAVQARAHRSIGDACMMMGRDDEARPSLSRPRPVRPARRPRGGGPYPPQPGPPV